jgi:hypothetical protein
MGFDLGCEGAMSRIAPRRSREASLMRFFQWTMFHALGYDAGVMDLWTESRGTVHHLAL